MASESWLVVGLGNPGENYRHTRHNVGFRVVEQLVLKHDPQLKEKDRAIFGSYPLKGRKVFLFFPQTYMNDSGAAVVPFLKYHCIPIEHLLVVYDDLDLPVGKLRLKTSGSSGGHHGMDSIIAHLGSSDFHRLRVGIAKPPEAGSGANYVLSDFRPEEKAPIDEAVRRAAQGVETLILKGPEAAMQGLNGEA